MATRTDHLGEQGDGLVAVDAATRRVDEQRDPGVKAGGDLYPTNAADHEALLGWCMTEFTRADKARHDLEQRWSRYYKLYRSFVRRSKGDWHSKVFIPVCFYVVEAIVPRMVAQLPVSVVSPVGPEDEDAAKYMQEMLEWASRRSRLYKALIDIYKSSLKYGTGIAKVHHVHQTKMVRTVEPVMSPQVMTSQTPVLDEQGQPMTDVNGAPMMSPQELQVGSEDTGETAWGTTERVVYDGPVTEYVDIFNFFPAPEATDIDDARYVIHRVWRDEKHVRKMLKDGIYRMPPGMEMGDLWSGQSDVLTDLKEEVGSGSTDPKRRLAEVMEFWTDDTVMVMLNRRAIVRVDINPYEHGRKPFVRIPDYQQEGEFWGIGEIEQLEGMQDLINAMWNQRVDNVRLVMNRMFAFDPDNIHDTRDLSMRPGGTIRVKTHDMPVGQVLQPLEIQDVTSSAYTEVEELMTMTEKVSGVSAYTTGTDTSQMNDTATGISLISEQGNTRFSLKVRIAEVLGLTPMFEMFAEILQQFMPDEMTVKIINDQGQQVWQTITAESIQGAFDLDIEANSSTVTESVQKEQAMSLMQTFAQILDPATQQPVLNLQELAKDVLIAFQKKNLDRYLQPEVPPQAPQQMMLPGAMGQAPAPGGPAEAQGPPSPGPAPAAPPGPDPNQDPNAMMAALAATQGPPPQGGPPPQ